jgi:D-sedoheptulose 7-phosphate isomerase
LAGDFKGTAQAKITSPAYNLLSRPGTANRIENLIGIIFGRRRNTMADRMSIANPRRPGSTDKQGEQRQAATVVLKQYLQDFNALLNKVDSEEVETLLDLLTDAYRNGRFVFIIGNGGSGANASHLCQDLGKGTLHNFDNQKRLKVMSLTDNTPCILAYGNDLGYDRIFVEQLKNFAQRGAILLAISGSGNSLNILKTVEWANANALKTVGITGYDGGKLKHMCHYNLHVPSFNMGAVEAAHGVIFHYLVDTLYDRFKAVAETVAC